MNVAKNLHNGFPHVLIVSHHWDAQKIHPFAGIFVDRQIASLKNTGTKITLFNVGATHNPITILKKWFELRHTVKALNPDLVHGQYGTIVGFMAAFSGRPGIISFCGNDLLPGASVSSLRAYVGFFLSNLGALKAKALICKSKELQKALWWRPGRSYVIPNGVDLTLFSPGPKDQARSQLGINHNRPIVILNIGSDAIRKGLKMAQEAMEVAKTHIPDVEMIVLSKVAADKMPLYYRAADVLLCASKVEGSPNVVKEALACNLPVVSTPVGDVPERLKDVWPSAIVPADSKAMAQALIEILKVRKRSNGREHIAFLGMDQVADKVLSVYHSVKN